MANFKRGPRAGTTVRCFSSKTAIADCPPAVQKYLRKHGRRKGQIGDVPVWVVGCGKAITEVFSTEQEAHGFAERLELEQSALKRLADERKHAQVNSLIREDANRARIRAILQSMLVSDNTASVEQPISLTSSNP